MQRGHGQNRPLVVPEDVRAELEFVPVETIEGLLKEALDVEIPPAGALFAQGESDNDSGAAGSGRD
mgnify:CR=1 FL=1